MGITVNRIKGALSGSIIGEALAQYQQDYFQHNFTNISPCLEIAFSGIESLIDCDQIDQKSWLVHVLNQHPDYLKYKNSLNLAETAIVLVPFILYYYDNQKIIEFVLNQAVKLWSKPKLDPDYIRLWILIVHQICLKKLTIAQNNSIVNIVENNFLLKKLESLELIENCLTNKLSLTSFTTLFEQQFDSESLVISLAIYSFWSLPDDFYLSLNRVTKINNQPVLTSILTGFLLGLNGNHFSIPFSHRRHLESTAICQKITQLSENFYRVWRGEYLAT